MDFKDVFMTYYVPLCNYANSLLSSDSLAEDVVQDVFMHLWKNNEHLSLNTSMQAFLFSSVKNKVYENARTRKAYQQAIDRYHNEKKEILSGKSENDEAYYMNMERLSSLLRHLPPKCRNVFALHKFNGLTYAEIAEKEGISIKTVENHLSKAVKILRTKYSEQ